MIDDKIEAALNRQLAQELSSAYVYLSMAAYFEYKNLPGFAHWANLQYQEENAHSIRFFKYINDRNGRVILEQISKPKDTWKSVVHVFEDILEIEKHTTKSINRLMALAKAENDYATENMLQWFIAEQVEEEAHAIELLAKVNLIKDSASGLFLLDKELSKSKL